MNETEFEVRSRLKEDFPFYAKSCLKIRTKEGRVLPFKLNQAQLYIHSQLEKQLKETGKVRAIILKGRQQGCSTLIEGRFYWIVTHSKGVRAFILTHDKDATNNLFEMAQRYHINCPEIVKPIAGTDNSKELEFSELDSGYKVGTAGNKAVGRSSTIQLFHGSEVAFWPNADEHAKGIMQALPNTPGTEAILESTANGIGNYFHQQWQMAETHESEYIPIFVPWFWQDEYQETIKDGLDITHYEMELRAAYKLTNEQLLWRRKKIVELSSSGIDGEKAFMQEYPCAPAEAFQTTGDDSFIPPSLVMNARKSDYNKPSGLKYLGVDPARFGNDRTSIIRRHGRIAYGLESYSKLDTMKVVGIVHKIIKEDKPDKVLIDVGGLGAGVVDRLKELGYSQTVIGINSGQSPLDGERYLNKKAEMWAEMKLWLQEEPCSVPDSDSLHADLCSPSYYFDSKTRLIIEKKEDIKKRGIRSPDEADALALTFSFPAVSSDFNVKKLLNPTFKF